MAQGTGLDVAAPLKFNHAANLPFSNRGTGISFKPATAFGHSSNEPVQPLGAGITLDNPLARDHAIDAVVRDAAVTTAGYQGPPRPTNGSAAPLSLPSPATWCCVTPAAELPTASITASSSTHGLARVTKPLPERGKVAAARLPPAQAAAVSAGVAVRLPRPIGVWDASRTARTPTATAPISCCNPPRLYQPVHPQARPTSKSRASQTLPPARRLPSTPGRTSKPRSSRRWARGRHHGGRRHGRRRDRDPCRRRIRLYTRPDVSIDSGANLETAVIASFAGGRGGGARITVSAPLTRAHPAGARSPAPASPSPDL